MYKVSPSDFAYLYEECKLCYWLKVKENIKRPFSPFPAVFSAMNNIIQSDLLGKSIQNLSPELPEGIIESQEGFVRSKKIPGTNIFISGKYDLLVKQPDGTYLLVDLKISKPVEEKAERYKTQLASYKFALENSQKEDGIKVTRHGLLILYPDSVDYAEDKALIDFAPTWMEVPDDSDGFLKFMKEVDLLLSGPAPAETDTCEWCKYRHMDESVVHEPQQTDIPF